MSIYDIIARGIKPIEFENPMNMMTQMSQIQNYQQANQLNQMKMDEARRSAASMNQMRTLYADPTIDRTKPEFLRRVYEIDPELGRKVEESQAKIGAQKSTQMTQEALQRKTEEEIIDKSMVRFRANAPNVGSPEGAAEHIRRLYADPVLGKIALSMKPLEQAVTEAMTYFTRDPNQWRLLHSNITGAQIFDAFKRTRQTTDLGGVIRAEAIDWQGNVIPGSAVDTTKTISPGTAATVEASLANAKATRDAARLQADATRDAAGIRRDQDTEMKLADDYRAQSKSFKDVSESVGRIKSVIGDAKSSPAATLAAATSFMRLLDPASVVRESELRMALAATGVFDRATNYHNKLLLGQVLTKDQAIDFGKITDQVFEAAKTQQRMVDANYKRQAETYKLRPEMIMQDMGQNVKPKPAGVVTNPNFPGFSIGQ